MIIDLTKLDTEIKVINGPNTTTYLLKLPNPVPVPEPEPIKTKWPQGKGMLIWQLARIANGNMATMAAQAKDAGFKWISIKFIENGKLYIKNLPLLKSAVDELRKVGIGVRGWGYLYPQNAGPQGKDTANALKPFELDGYELDVEGEWKTNIGDFRQNAVAYCSEYRNVLPELGTGLCSFRYPNMHPLPWKEFLSICDYHAPQVYWVGTVTAGAPKAQLIKSYSQLIALKNIPYIPIGISCSHPVGNVTWNPSIDQLNNFHASVKEFNYPAHGWYDYINAWNNQIWWQTIKGHN
jgi:hypothetical protein